MDAFRLVKLLARTAKIAGGIAHNTARENAPSIICNGTFTFKPIKNNTAYTTRYFIKFADPSVKSVIIPSEYKGVPIKEVGASTFFGSGYLTSVVISEGIEEIGVDAFGFCPSLEEVRLPKSLQRVYEGAFRECPLLPAETVMTGLCRSPDITRPFREPYFPMNKFDWDTALREDVFLLAMKYHSFSEFDREQMLAEITRRDIQRYMRLMEQAGMFSDVEHLNGYIDESVKNYTPEITAWLLDYKNRVLGFNKGDEFEI